MIGASCQKTNLEIDKSKMLIYPQNLLKESRVIAPNVVGPDFTGIMNQNIKIISTIATIINVTILMSSIFSFLSRMYLLSQFFR